MLKNDAKWDLSHCFLIIFHIFHKAFSMRSSKLINIISCRGGFAKSEKNYIKFGFSDPNKFSSTVF